MSFRKIFPVLMGIALILLCRQYAFAADLSIMISESESYLVTRAVETLSMPGSFKIRIHTPGDILRSEDARRFINNSDLIIVDVMIRELTDYLVEHRKELKTERIYALRGSRDDQALKEAGFIFDPQISVYFKHLTVDNIRNMISCLIHREFDSKAACRPVARLPVLGIYHPGSKRIFTDYTGYLEWYAKRRGFDNKRPWIGLMLFTTSLAEGRRAVIDTLIKRLESSGFNIIAGFGKDALVLKSFMLDPGHCSRVDLLLSFSLKFYSAMNRELKGLLKDLDVPVVNAVTLFSQTIGEWEKDPAGIPPVDVVWTLSNPEISGLVEPTPLAGRVRAKSKSGKDTFIHEPIHKNIDRLIPRLWKWARLRRMPNREKKVAIIYYNHSQGKQNIGASYLNIFRSLEVILKRMAGQGYSIDPNFLKGLDEKKIRDMILKTGRNIGSWAPGELELMVRDKSVIRVPLKTYEKWFAELPAAFRKAVLGQWGPPESAAIMVKDSEFIIPAVSAGNLVLMPEPSRGWSDDPMKLYHDTTLYPHHQYIAAYLWIQKRFRADVMIHLGTHATYEWLPGKQAGLAPSDPPEVMVGDIPNLYPYIVDDVGEGIQAKRRGRGVVIDHLVPPLKKSGLYKEYAEIKELIGEYDRAVSRGSRTAQKKLLRIKRLAKKTGLDHDLKDLLDQDDFLMRLEHYIDEIKTAVMPYGMHTFGRSPEGPALDDTVRHLLDVHGPVDRKEVERRLSDSGEAEIDRLMAGLKGRYIPPGEGNDPARNLDAVPTGKNFYGFSPDRIPSPSAWSLGKRVAADIIQKSLKEKGVYPKKVGLVLWATETIRNEGINESAILYLLGMEPVWDRTGRVIKARVIPGRRLGRPRIDVLVNPSGLYRDLFPEMILFLDDAIQKAAVQTDIENLIAENSVAVKKRLIAAGMDEKEASYLSTLRIFSEKPGSYGTGVSEMTGAPSFWEQDDEIVDVYENRLGFAFGRGRWGVSARGVLKENLKGVDTVIHSLSSSIYGTMDNDDMFQYLGGLSMAVKRESGKRPDTLIALNREKGDVVVEDATLTIGKELRIRYLNPRWIEGMKKDKYAGAHAISEFLENMWGWQVTVPDSIDPTKWEQAFAVYVKDRYDMGLKEFFNRENPWAFQSMTARMLEAVRKEYWHADEKIKKRLAVEYAGNVVEKGVACCDHTCNNPALNQMVVNILSLPGVASPELAERFRIAVERAAKKKLQEQSKAVAALKKRLAGKEDPGKADEGSVRAREPEKRMEAVKGYRMEEIRSEEKETELTSSGVQWVASLLVFFVIGLVVAGTRLKR